MNGLKGAAKLPTRVIFQNIQTLSNFFDLTNFEAFEGFWSQLTEEKSFSKDDFQAIIRDFMWRYDSTGKPLECCIISVFSKDGEIAFQAPLPLKISPFLLKFYRFSKHDRIF